MPQRRTSAPDAKEEGGSCEALGGGSLLFLWMVSDRHVSVDRYMKRKIFVLSNWYTSRWPGWWWCEGC